MIKSTLKEVLQDQALLRKLIFEHLEQSPLDFTKMSHKANLNKMTVRNFLMHNAKVDGLTVQKLWKWLKEEV